MKNRLPFNTKFSRLCHLIENLWALNLGRFLQYRGIPANQSWSINFNTVVVKILVITIAMYWSRNGGHLLFTDSVTIKPQTVQYTASKNGQPQYWTCADLRYGCLFHYKYTNPADGQSTFCMQNRLAQNEGILERCVSLCGLVLIQPYYVASMKIFLEKKKKNNKMYESKKPPPPVLDRF